MRKLVGFALAAVVLVIALGPRPVAAADYAGTPRIGQQTGTIFTGDCSTAVGIALGGDLQVVGSGSRFSVQIVAYVGGPTGSVGNVIQHLYYSVPVGSTHREWHGTLPASWPGNGWLMGQTVPLGATQCLIWFYLDPSGPLPSTTGTLTILNPVIREYPRPGGGGATPGPEPSPTDGPSPTASPSAPPSHMCHASGTITFGGSWVTTVNDGVITATGGTGSTAPGCPLVLHAGDVPYYRATVSRGWFAAWAFADEVSGWSGGQTPDVPNAYGTQDGLCWSAQDRHSSTSPAVAAWAGADPGSRTPKLNLHDGGSGWGCSSGSQTSTWEIWVDFTAGPTASGYPSPSPTPSDPFAGLPSTTPEPLPPGGGGGGGGVDICLAHPGISACSSWPPQPPNPDLCDEHPDVLACATMPASSATADPEGAEDAFGELIEDAKGKVPFGYVAQAADAITEGVSGAGGGSGADYCFDYPWNAPVSDDGAFGTVETADLCLPLAEYAGYASVFRGFLATVLVLLIAVTVLRKVGAMTPGG